jgi:HK97 gp10 family phage protein
VSEARFQIQGLADLERKISELPQKLARNVMRGALRAGANTLRAEARAKVPVDSGALRQSIRVSARLRGTKATARVTAGGRARKGDAFYAHMVEFGTQAHKISANMKRALVINGQLVRGEISHPGARPRPFMRPALDAKAQQAIEDVARYIRERLAKEAA